MSQTAFMKGAEIYLNDISKFLDDQSLKIASHFPINGHYNIGL